MTRVHLVRHGRAAAGWDRDRDPDLDELGLAQAAAAADRLEALGAPATLVVTSPLQRCRRTAAVLCERWGVAPRVEKAIAEIPSPVGIEMVERVEWLRDAARGTWSELGEPYTTFRDGVVAWIAGARARHGRVLAFRRHQRRDRCMHRRRSTRRPSPRQLLDHRGGRRGRSADIGRRWARGRHPHPLVPCHARSE